MKIVNYSRLNSKEFIGLSSFQFLIFFRRLLIYTFLAIYLKEKIGLSTTEITLMASLPMIISASAQSFLWGPLLDKIHRSHLFVIIGEIIAAVLHLIMVQLHIYSLENNSLRYAGYVIIGMLIIIEFPWSASNVGLMTLIAERTDDTERTRLIGQLSIGGGIGAIFGAFTGSFFYDDGIGFSEGDLFYIAAFVMICSALIIYSTIHSIEINDTKPQNLDEYTEPNLKLPVFNLRHHFLPFLVALTLINFGRNGVNIITSLFISNDNSLNATDSEIALYRNLGSFASLVTGVIIGSRLGKKNDALILQIGTIMSIIGLFWLVITPSYQFALLAALLVGSANIIVQASSYSITVRIIPDHQKGKLIGYFNATFFLSWGLGATIIFAPLVDLLVFYGYSFDTSYRFAFLVSGTMIVFGLFIFKRFINRVNNQ
jgi:predicted MFS family arabinose efflux permease